MADDKEQRDRANAGSDGGHLQNIVYWFEKALRVGAIAAFVAVGIAMALNLPSSPTRRANPSFLDDVFASRLTLFVARVVLVEGAIFLVFSMTIRTLRGDWATKAGPVDTSASNSLSDAVEELAQWKDRATQAESKVEDLEERLRETEATLQQVLGALEATEKRLHRRGEDG